MSSTWWVSLEDLNDEQRAVMALPQDQSVLLSGPPGSGKTNLLLLRANYLWLAGKANLAIVVYTRSLQEFMALGGAQYSFPPAKLRTFVRWAKDLLREFGADPSKQLAVGDYDEERQRLLASVAKVIEQRRLSSLYDALLLDEAQDYRPEEVELFLQLSPLVFAVADLRQKIYKGDDPVESLRRRCKEVRLRYHYRNGPAICRFADALAKDSLAYEPLATSCNYDQKLGDSAVEHVACSDLSEQASQLLSRVETQIKAYPEALIGVMCPRREELQYIWDEALRANLGDVSVLQVGGSHGPFDENTRVCFTTMHGGKGLEFRAAHIAGLEKLSRFSHQRNLIYTAATRARTSLSLYSTGSVPGFLEKAIESMRAARPTPRMEDAFGRGKKR